MKIIFLKISFLPLMMVSLFGQTARAADFYACPSELKVAANVSEPPSGWEVINTDDRHPYVGVSFSLGPPSDQAILAPDGVRTIKSGRIAVWHFSDTVQAYWVSCLYAETSATVAKKLPANTGSCEVEYDGRFSAPVAKTWRCLPRSGR